MASFLPKSFVYGRSFRKAKSVHSKFEAATCKENFVAKFTEINIIKSLEVATRTHFYRARLVGNILAKQQLIDKDDVVSAGDEIVRSKLMADLITTGGTSGKPLAFHINKDRKGVEWYWMTAGWAKVGFDYKKSWRAVLRNQSLNGKMYEVNPLLKEVYFDNYRLEDDYLEFVTEEIKRRSIVFVHAYPSAAYTLALHWKKNGNAPGCVKTFLCGSENVFPQQKNLIQNELGKRMFTWFGHSEKLILAHEGETCENYHSNPFYGCTEIINESGEAVTVKGEFGELVGTGYINTKTPFIRYRTGDFAEYVGQSCPDCGHVGLTFKNVKGRWAGEKVYLLDGKSVSTTSLNLHDAIYTQVDGLQYYQEKMGQLEIRVIANSLWNNNSGDLLVNYLKSKIPEGLEFTLKIVAELEFTKNRKYQLLIQRVKSV